MVTTQQLLKLTLCSLWMPSSNFIARTTFPQHGSHERAADLLQNGVGPQELFTHLQSSSSSPHSIRGPVGIFSDY
ncbi:hypothetical protein AMECASPLE_008315 [Ameca splendens]|uniref:Uncharacterized protein n=1 Tax=Ameca splendens TaxID=208324 RepID=A0ABV0YN76_9TELE